MLNKLKQDLQNLANPKQAAILQRFFKTGRGEYGEGDIFLGIKVPDQRRIAKKYIGLSLPKIQQLLKSKVHEHRLVGLLILVDKFRKVNVEECEQEKGNIFNFYLKNTKNINNWDLVDLTAPNIVGDFLFDKKKDTLYKLAESKNIWERRISIIACFAFIRKEEFNDALRISEILLNDAKKSKIFGATKSGTAPTLRTSKDFVGSHDLIHKAVGWMLREIGKRDQEILENFLRKHYKDMPRTTLRYSIERFPEDLRKKYLRGEV